MGIDAIKKLTRSITKTVINVYISYLSVMYSNHTLAIGSVPGWVHCPRVLLVGQVENLASLAVVGAEVGDVTV